ncbi:50S ribosomal protein L29 [Bacteroidetes bacterium endosymbiont of Geopemphigus sp.]|uniref:50S ribosomal protein L29 n=1 Tax=Bacteroidetes bacterium endosymbiont of Geopemphigus sp. TaxID=2047937 RepID=UPI000CD20E9D|nr:50S ribosomal protein L29 [Bacteroidetes bacterium endosymbiont of Geopemphigus sp.]
MKITDIRNLSIEEIRQKLKNQTTEYERAKFSHKVSSLQNPIKLRNNRRLIARISTVLQQKLEEAAQ